MDRKSHSIYHVMHPGFWSKILSVEALVYSHCGSIDLARQAPGPSQFGRENGSAFGDGSTINSPARPFVSPLFGVHTRKPTDPTERAFSIRLRHDGALDRVDALRPGESLHCLERAAAARTQGAVWVRGKDVRCVPLFSGTFCQCVES